MAPNNSPPLLEIAPPAASNPQTDYGSDIDLSEFLRVEARDAPAAIPTRGESEFGSDLDPADLLILEELLDDFEVIGVKSLVIDGLEEEVEDVTNFAKVPKYSSQGSHSAASTQYFSAQEESRPELPGNSAAVHDSGLEANTRPSNFSLAREAEELPKPVEISAPLATKTAASHNHEAAAGPRYKSFKPSPLNQFRAWKPLAVTDLTGPAWCELQFFKSLTKYGRMKRTAAMKKGSTVHKKLELEVHEFIPIDVQTKEDSWGLRFWNVIQGLRTLRLTGITREVPVWGVIDGLVISGIIDELSYACPDPDLEYALDESSKISVEDSGIFLQSTQRTIDEFYPSQKSMSAQNPKRERKVYITDTKTRSTPNLPGGSSVRPTMMQLMIYHHLLCLLSTNQVPSQPVFEKYKLNGEQAFSQIFLSQIASLEFNLDSDVSASSATAHPSTQLSTTGLTIGELGGQTNLNGLWNLMVREYQRTLSPAVLSPILNASYRYQPDGTILGSKSFVYDNDILRSFVADELDFWRGNREPRGVDIEDAFKCGTCEFAKNCEWRIEKHRAMIRPKVRHRRRRSSASSSPAFESPPPRSPKHDASEACKK